MKGRGVHIKVRKVIAESWHIGAVDREAGINNCLGIREGCEIAVNIVSPSHGDLEFFVLNERIVASSAVLEPVGRAIGIGSNNDALTIEIVKGLVENNVRANATDCYRIRG